VVKKDTKKLITKETKTDNIWFLPLILYQQDVD